MARESRRALVERARALAQLSRAPAHHVARHRARLHQLVRELRAATRRAVVDGDRMTMARVNALSRKAAAASARVERTALPVAALDRAGAAALASRRRELERVLATLAAHDPQRTLERGYALVEDASGAPVTSAAVARSQRELTLRLHDGRVDVGVRPSDP
jgi:exodeoxyribonuclease VII large subunit